MQEVEIDSVEKNPLKPTWLEDFIVRAVGHIEATKLDSDLVAASLAYGKSYFDHV